MEFCFGSLNGQRQVVKHIWNTTGLFSHILHSILWIVNLLIVCLHFSHTKFQWILTKPYVMHLQLYILENSLTSLPYSDLPFSPNTLAVPIQILPSPPLPLTYWPFCCLNSFTFFKMLYKWKHIVHTLFTLIFFYL